MYKCVSSAYFETNKIGHGYRILPQYKSMVWLFLENCSIHHILNIVKWEKVQEKAKSGELEHLPYEETLQHFSFMLMGVV